MRLTCPSCAAEYEIDQGAIGARGRKVRCANCAAEWFQPAAGPSVSEAAAAVEAAAGKAARERAERRHAKPADEPRRESEHEPEPEHAPEIGPEQESETVFPPEPRRERPPPEPRAIDGESTRREAPGERRAAGWSGGDMNPDEFAASLRAEEEISAGPRAGAAFLAGFATMVFIAAVFVGVYMKRAEIAELVPATQAPLAAYADLVDQGRAALDRFVAR